MAAVLSVAAVYFSVYASAYIVIIVGILVAAGFLIYLKHTGIPIFYVLFIMMFPVMCLRTKDIQISCSFRETCLKSCILQMLKVM